MTTDNAELVKRLRERGRELFGSMLITGQDDARMLFDAAAKLSTQERVIVELEKYRKFTGMLLFDYCEDWGTDIGGEMIEEYLIKSGLAKD